MLQDISALREEMAKQRSAFEEHMKLLQEEHKKALLAMQAKVCA
jgi:hypothetical protein